jgi:glucose-6-phosphate dehydrogenase assembly protein OpcA
MGIDYEQGNAAQALMYLGWPAASRVGLETGGLLIEEGGVCSIKKIHFHNPQDRLIRGGAGRYSGWLTAAR